VKKIEGEKKSPKEHLLKLNPEQTWKTTKNTKRHKAIKKKPSEK